MARIDLKELDWEVIVTQLPQGWRELAVEMGLIQDRPKHMGAKITEVGQVLRLVFYHVAGSSLRMTTAAGAASKVISMSAVALHKWMKKIGPYLAALLARMVGSASYAPERWAGFDVIVADATTVQRPGSKGTTARVHYALRLSDMSPRYIEATDEHGGETARRFCAEAMELWLFDRAYSNPPGVAWMRGRGAHVIVRYNRGSLPLYDVYDRPLDVGAAVLRTKERGIVHERLVRVHGPDNKRIEGRLCWLKLPTDKVEQARARARREGETSAESLQWAEYVVVFTTVDGGKLTADQILELYRARWQVELAFKRAKSIQELDRLPNFLPETIYSWICANLLLQLVAHHLSTPTVAFPPGAVGLSSLPAAAVVPKPRRRRALVRHQAGVDRRPQRAAAARAA